MAETDVIFKNISFSKELSEKIDKECQRLGISFTGFIRLRAQSYFEDGIAFEIKDNNKEGGKNNDHAR